MNPKFPAPEWTASSYRDHSGSSVVSTAQLAVAAHVFGVLIAGTGGA